MIYCKEDDDFLLNDIILSDFDESPDQLQYLINVDCALALSICKTRNLPSCVFVLSLLYMKRLRSLHSLIKIDNLTREELYLIATLLADKYLIDEGEDDQLFNSDLTELTNIPTERINLIERQVLLALNWNLYISNDEFKQFQSQMINRLNKHIENNDSIRFYLMYFKFLPHTIGYLSLASLILLGSTLSILIAIHIGTLKYSAWNPPMNCSQLSVNITKEMNDFDLEKYPWIRNETTDNNYTFDLSTNVLLSPLSITCTSCSIVESFG